MDSPNPYLAPAALTPRTSEPPPGLSHSRAFTIIAATAGGCAVLGALLGYLIGVLLPDYYHAVFDDTSLNTLQVGVGLGLTQGLGAGLAVGVLVVLAISISARRRA